MLTRTASHYPNSGHTTDTLSVLAEDWYETFKDRFTDRAFIDAVTEARRGNRFFPTETDIFDQTGRHPNASCGRCQYNQGSPCKNLSRKGFDTTKCNAYAEVV